MLEVQSIYKRYQKKIVLENVSLTIGQGEIVGLVGENGAGKSTLLQMLATLMKPDKGEIYWQGMAYHQQQKAIRQKIGFVPQDLAIWEHFSVEDNMRYFERLSWKRIGISACQQICQDMQLTQWKEPVSSLSGGMKRKLNLAISLIHQPELLLLDEPTVGIDMRSKQEIGRFLQQLARSQGTTIIYTSHDMNEIEQFTDRVLLIGKDRYYEELLTAKGIQVDCLS
ncbi:ABC transporter ATP-binding protein [Lysinibacillus louembei]|uniref:ABC transporter ATP-binding protein n=1 Tax=Lysinibacillus louembei TaxID=1470088 RepID=A0ABZ0RQ45_9BACI|nr:ABC transporter ATP-binding protein [Lysinibacillus louembei]WPK10347.1 ABC transporter ATP-binding protein [Lysinibacillus louembei]